MASLLIIDDSARQRLALREALEEAELFDRILEAEDGIRGLKLLVSEEVEMVICDLEMPGLDGDKLIRMSSSVQARAIPFLMLTGVQDAKRHARLLDQGARDVITKPFHPLDLIARIKLHRELIRLQDELMEKNHQLERLSTTDSLTGLPNRRHIDEALEREYQRTSRQGLPLCVLMVDIDYFKQVNDRHGHASGDLVICAVADKLSERLRASDVGGRWGGEEFMVLLGSPLEGAEILAERIRESVEALEVQAETGQSIRVTVSIGVACHPPGAKDAAGLVAAADAALYQAKEEGRNRVVVWCDEF